MTTRQDQMETTSVLPKQYWEKKSSQGRILDQPELGLLELYPAGFTKPNAHGISRQAVHNFLYTTATNVERECSLYPFENIDHQVSLVREPENIHDRHALKILFTGGSEGILKAYGADMGYVPARINRMIGANLDKFNGGRILKVQKGVHGKYYRAKVVFAYNHASFESMLDEEMQRFSRLVDD